MSSLELSRLIDKVVEIVPRVADEVYREDSSTFLWGIQRRPNLSSTRIYDYMRSHITSYESPPLDW
jgi:hypothetical protein